SDVTHVDRIATAFVIRVRQQGGQIICFVIELEGNGHVESLVAGEVPSSAAHVLGFLRKTGAISALVGPLEDVITGGNYLALALGEEGCIQLVRSQPATLGGESVAADGMAVALAHFPPTPAPGSTVGRVKPGEQ